MANTPQISIGLPVYNGLPYVRELIESMLAQSFTDFELVICDNASTDGTEALCRGYAQADARVKYFRNPTNIGLIPNFNKVFELATAPFYKWAASDDLYEPTYLEACFPAIRDNPGVSLSHSQTMLVSETGEALPYDPALHACADPHTNRLWLLDRDNCAEAGSRVSRFRDVLVHQIMCAPIYGLMRREQLLHTGLHKSFFGSDKLLLAELALMGRFHIARGCLFRKRMHTGMTSMMSGSAQRTKIDPGIAPSSPRLMKLRGYLNMLATKRLTLAERIACYAYLSAYSAAAAIPETLRYRPELVSMRLGLKRPSPV
jgi:glycosyltransferase involved in cell wall biosynthesis